MRHFLLPVVLKGMNGNISWKLQEFLLTTYNGNGHSGI
jgi:hypothetical protein